MDYMPQFGQNAAPTQDVSGIPANDAAAQLEMKRRLRMAQSLQDQKAPEGQMVSGHYVAPSWTQYAAQLAGNYVGNKKEEEAIKQYSDYEQAKQQKMRESALKLGKALDPRAITEQSTFDIQVPNGQTPTPTDNLGGMQPYESGMKTISVPQTNTTGYRQPTQAEIYNAIGEYSANTNNNDLLEKSILGRVSKKLDGGGKYSIHNIGNMGIELDESGRPTGTQYDYTSQKPIDYGTAANSGAMALFGKDFKDLSQPEQKKVVDYVNQYRAGALSVSQGNLANQTATTGYNTTPVTTTYNPPAAKPAMSAQDQQALAWANANPNDPRAKAVKQRLGVR